LAALDFALRARTSHRVSDVWLSVLAAALMTGAKQTNLPLGLPWIIALWPSLKVLIQKPRLAVVMLLPCLLVSLMPIGVLNNHYCGSWTGISRAPGDTAYVWGAEQELHSPFWALLGNSFCFPLQNLLPPIFPLAGQWNEAMQRFVETPFGSHFRSFELFGHLGNGASETTVGIGLWIVTLTLISLFAVRRYRRRSEASGRLRLGWYLWLVCLAPWLSLLFFLAKVGTYQNARHAASYYVFLFPLLLIQPGHSFLVRRRWWQRLGLVVMLLSAALLVVSRARPLFPAVTLLSTLREHHPDSRALNRLWQSYGARLSVFEQRHHFQKYLTPDEKVIGFATTCGGAEPGLWLPFGSRRVERILPRDTAEDLHARGIHYVVIDDDYFLGNEKIEGWLTRYGAVLADHFSFQKDPGAPLGNLYLVRLSGKTTVAQTFQTGPL
jgi:hypothetical protein